MDLCPRCHRQVIILQDRTCPSCKAILSETEMDALGLPGQTERQPSTTRGPLPPPLPPPGSYSNAPSGPRPAVMNLAVKLMWASLVLGPLRLFLEWDDISPYLDTKLMLIILVFSLGIPVWLTLKIGQGRAWSRTVYLVLFILGLIPSVQSLAESLTNAPLSGVLGIAQAALQAIGLVLCFTPQAKAWFK